MSQVDQLLARRLAAEEAHHRGLTALAPERAVVSFTRALLYSPDVPRFRLGFARALSRIEPAGFSRPAAVRVLRRSGVLRGLAIVLAAGGRPAATVEPFASGFLLSLRSLRRALTTASAAPLNGIDNALRARPLHCGSGAPILRALLTGTMIREPYLLDLLDIIRHTLARAIVANPSYEPTRYVKEFANCLAAQIWIQDGVLTMPPEPSLMDALANPPRMTAALELGRKLLPHVIAPNYPI